MQNLRYLIIIVSTLNLLGFAAPGGAEESLAVVTQRSSDINNISLETLKLVYLRKLMLDSNGTRWIPLSLPSSHELRQIFSLALFKKRPDEMEDYWNEQYFQGVTPPQVLASEEAVLRFVSMTPGAIGYVRQRNVDERVKVLKVIPISADN
jgi:hypothetical protein